GEGADYPDGASLINEIFKRMPNDTDFSVSIRAEIPGIDFAFAGERNHYHTPNDNLENLDLRTLQHHGENVLPLARNLVMSDLAALEDATLVYSNVYGLWISWPTELSLYLVFAAVVLLLITSLRIDPQPSKLAIAIGSPLLIIVASSLVLFLNFKLIELVNGTTVPWPANDFPFRVVLFSAPAVVGFCLASLANRFLTEEEGLLGLWWFWSVLALACALLLPDAANLLILPLLVASMLLVVATILPTSAGRAIQLLTLVMVLPASLNMVLLLEVTQGYRLIATTFFSLGIFFASIAPFVRGVLVKPAIVIGVFLIVGGTAGAMWVPLYSTFRPQHLNFHFVQDLDENTAYWWAQTQNPVPEKVATEMEFVHELLLYPWSESKTKNLALAETIDIASPRFVIGDIRNAEQGQSFDITVSSMRNASRIFFIFPEASGLQSFNLHGDTFEANVAPRGPAKGNYVIGFSGVQNKQVGITLNFAGTGPHIGYLAEGSRHLPPSAVILLKARGSLAVPVHRGDQFISFQKIEL
ncbi:MAG: M28 family peptidase, partial [Gammaproteobacteria bacterium]|nr:M28 family peptidase [Gammaproteobacteria bacterium]